MAKNLSRSIQRSNFLLLLKNLNFGNLANPYHTYMKLGPDIYQLKNFCLPKIEGVKEWAGEGCIQINTKTWHEINNISTLKSPNNTLGNAIKVGIILIKPLKI